LQREILRIVEEAEGPPTIEGLRWTTYQNLGYVIGRERKLPTKWNTSVRRAASGLFRGGHINISVRRLANFEECVAHYPYKSLSDETRKVRETFLPSLLKWFRDPRGFGPKYGVSSNEKFYLESLGEAFHEELKIRWSKIEDWLRSLYGTAKNSPDDLLKLICKGRGLFRESVFLVRRIHEGGGITVDAALTDLIEAVRRKQKLPDELATELEKLKELVLPRETASVLRFKSLVHELADIPRHGQCSLKQTTLDYLHQEMKTSVEKMPGFKQKEGLRYDFGGPPQFEYDSKLKKLFDHTVFQNFHFLSLS
jgi:hypothetical protein